MKTADSLVDEFEATLPFKLDEFQREAIEKLDRGPGGVLVSAPTSSGKTVVAEYAIFRALRAGSKVIYTTPLKALSNQKYHDFVKVYGESTVGLVTGENSINPDAPVVVMTTEILRNLIYEDLQRLDMVSHVVLDEVHYIDDFPRGSVWEEIVIQAPTTIKLVGLSATIGNFREIAEWMAENRGGMETVFHDVRPVELKLWLAINNRFLPLFKGDGAIDQRTWSKAAEEEEASYRVGGYSKLPSNDLLHVIEELRRGDMLPAIYFIFSRRGCREALQRCSYHDIDLTTAAEKEEIDKVAAARLEGLTDHDEEALFRRMVDARLLRRGLAEHHAGLLPYHKEMVEELFQRGLIKVVFATETLSLGINMPARGVVVSSFSKFDGTNFSNLTTGELTQLMGRAGRRGIDVIGHGVILKESDVEIGTIYEVAMGATLVVESKFLPSYNMALNLLRIYTPEQADALMERSFGQFQKRLAEERTRERLVNVRARLADIRKLWNDSEVSIDEVAQYFKLEDRRRSIRIELRRLRREAGAERRGRRGRQHTRTLGSAGRLRPEARGRGEGPAGAPAQAEAGALASVWRVPHQVRRDPHAAEGARRRRARAQGPDGRVRAQAAPPVPDPDRDGFPRPRPADRQGPLRLAHLRREHDPRRRGGVAGVARGSGARGAVRRADHAGGRGSRARRQRQAAARAAALSRPPRSRRRPGWCARCTSASPTWRATSTSPTCGSLRTTTSTSPTGGRRGEQLDKIPLPPNVDIGDAIKAMKSLYSLLRQLEWAVRQAKSPLFETVARAVAQMERDVIKRT